MAAKKTKTKPEANPHTLSLLPRAPVRVELPEPEPPCYELMLPPGCTLVVVADDGYAPSAKRDPGDLSRVVVRATSIVEEEEDPDDE